MMFEDDRVRIDPIAILLGILDPLPNGHLPWERRVTRSQRRHGVYSDLDVLSIVDLIRSEESRITRSGAPGLDLAIYHKDVRRILFAHFGRQCVAEGHDPEDLLQEVYRSILVRNQGENPFDPTLSSASHYIYLVCTSVFRNYRSKVTRYRSRETSIFGVGEDGDETMIDFPVAATQETDVALGRAANKCLGVHDIERALSCEGILLNKGIQLRIQKSGTLPAVVRRKVPHPDKTQR